MTIALTLGALALYVGFCFYWARQVAANPALVERLAKRRVVSRF